MIFKIAWRNIWRNKLRSWVVIVSIILGIWAGIFMMALSFGMNDSRAKSQIESFISDIQIHHKEYNIDYKLKYTIPSLEEVENVLKSQSDIIHYCKRVLVKEAMLVSAKANQGLTIIGVTPNEEKEVTDIYTKITKGEYFPDIKGKGILIGEKLAQKLQADVKSKVVIRYQDVEGNIIQTKFKVVGIFKTSNSMFDKSSVFVRNSDLEKTLNISKQFHEIAIVTSDKSTAKITKEIIESGLSSENEVQYWGEISPDLAYADEMMGQTLYIFMGIIMIALLFGIINTMLMAVLERKRELGMLMAIGMNKKRLFLMIMLETMMLALLGGPLGILLADFSVSYFGSAGIDISSVGEGMSSFGMESVIYPIIETSYYPGITLMVLITAFIGALFPARRALKLKPADSIRSL